MTINLGGFFMRHLKKLLIAVMFVTVMFTATNVSMHAAEADSAGIARCFAASFLLRKVVSTWGVCPTQAQVRGCRFLNET